MFVFVLRMQELVMDHRFWSVVIDLLDRCGLILCLKSRFDAELQRLLLHEVTTNEERFLHNRTFLRLILLLLFLLILVKKGVLKVLQLGLNNASSNLKIRLITIIDITFFNFLGQIDIACVYITMNNILFVHIFHNSDQLFHD